MKKVILYQALISISGAILLFFYGPQHSVSSYAAGALIITGNFILSGTGWNLVFRKKLIALSILIIVFKYAILGVIIYYFVKRSWLQPFWFAAGVTSMMAASLMYAITLSFFEEKPKEE